MKKNRLLINTTTWMNLTDTVLSQITIHKSYILYYFLKVQKQVKGIKVGGGVTSQDSGYLWARAVAGRVSNGGFWNAGNALLFIRWWLYGWINFVKIYQALCFLLMDFSVCVLYFL